ncbi:MAG TPA: CoA-binding protein [Thermoplasmata archaeon]|nr:CoA-binding protein [Thermoplasmata archaeon]
MDSADESMRALLTRARTIAVVGLSDKPDRDSYTVAEYLQQQGYRIIPVNPMVTEVLGERSYPSIHEIPPDVKIDIVDVFRRSDQVPPIVDEALARGVGALWLQLGVQNDAAAEKARARGVLIYQDICIRVQHRRLRVPPLAGAT